MAHKVMKPISANGEMIATGTVLDASGWRNVRALINNRYLVEIMGEVAPQVVETMVEKPVVAKVSKIKTTSTTKVTSK
jgi:NAD-dependent DNA ligase